MQAGLRAASGERELKAASVFFSNERRRPNEVTVFIKDFERFDVQPICSDSGRGGVCLLPPRQHCAMCSSSGADRLLPVCIGPTTQPMATAEPGRWAGLGRQAPQCQVQRLMRAHGIHGVKRRGSHAQHDPDAQRRPACDATSPPRPRIAAGWAT